MMEGSIIEHTTVFKKVEEYLNTNFTNSYIVYNLATDVDRSSGSLSQVMEYPFPVAAQVDYVNGPDPFCYMTAPPRLDSLFLVVIEMSAWLSQEDAQSNHIVVVHQADLKSSNVTMILSCLIAFLHRKVFLGGSIEVLPYVQKYAENYSFTKLSISQ